MGRNRADANPVDPLDPPEVALAQPDNKLPAAMAPSGNIGTLTSILSAWRRDEKDVLDMGNAFLKS